MYPHTQPVDSLFILMNLLNNVTSGHLSLALIPSTTNQVYSLPPPRRQQWLVVKTQRMWVLGGREKGFSGNEPLIRSFPSRNVQGSSTVGPQVQACLLGASFLLWPQPIVPSISYNALPLVVLSWCLDDWLKLGDIKVRYYVP